PARRRLHRGSSSGGDASPSVEWDGADSCGNRVDLPVRPRGARCPHREGDVVMRPEELRRLTERDEVTRGVENLAGSVCVVTGGASGIGRAVARSLHDRGATVVISDIEQSMLEDAKVDLDVLGVQADVSRRADVERLAEETLSRYGRVDVVVNNAGVARVAGFD